MSLLSKLVIGTAAWGDKPYGINQDHPSMRERLAIIRIAQEHGVKWFHVKDAYGVPDVLKERMKFRTAIEGMYTLDDCDMNEPRLMVPYNPRKQWVVEGLSEYTGELWVYSIFMQGKLIGNEEHLGVWSTKRRCINAAFQHPHIDRVVVGLNSVYELNYLIDVVKHLNEVCPSDSLKKLCLGPCDETDPRTWN